MGILLGTVHKFEMYIFMATLFITPNWNHVAFDNKILNRHLYSLANKEE